MTPAPRGERLGDERVAAPPFPSDSEPRDAPPKKKRSQARGEAAHHRPEAVGKDCDLKNRAPAESIREYSEQDPTPGGHSQREAQDQGVFLPGEVQLPGDFGEKEAVENQIVEIEKPAGPGQQENPPMGRRQVVLV